MTLTGRAHCGARSGLHDTHHRKLELLAEPWKRVSGRRVARDDHQLHVQADEVVYDLEREPPYLGEVTNPIGHARRVPKVDRVLVG